MTSVSIPRNGAKKGWTYHIIWVYTLEMSGIYFRVHHVQHLERTSSEMRCLHISVLPSLTTAWDIQCQSEQFEILSQSAEQRLWSHLNNGHIIPFLPGWETTKQHQLRSASGHLLFLLVSSSSRILRHSWLPRPKVHNWAEFETGGFPKWMMIMPKPIYGIYIYIHVCTWNLKPKNT